MMGVVIVVVHVVVAIVLLTVVPIGLRLVAGPEVAALRRVWWTPAGLAVVSLWLPRGPLTGALTLPYLLLTAALAAAAAWRAGLARRAPDPGHPWPV